MSRHRVLHLAWALRRSLFALLRIRTRGVKVLVLDANGAVLLIRNAYGKTGQWVLPGGGVRWREDPARAAIREVREECGCTIEGLSCVGQYFSTIEGRRDTIILFRATSRDAPIADAREIAEARFFARDALPADVSPATLRRLGELAGGPTSLAW